VRDFRFCCAVILLLVLLVGLIYWLLEALR
jgi:hypothetical protein